MTRTPTELIQNSILLSAPHNTGAELELSRRSSLVYPVQAIHAISASIAMHTRRSAPSPEIFHSILSINCNCIQSKTRFPIIAPQVSRIYFSQSLECHSSVVSRARTMQSYTGRSGLSCCCSTRQLHIVDDEIQNYRSTGLWSISRERV
jgi:hypothetical protein